MKPKPTKAWAVVSKRNKLSVYGGDQYGIFATKKYANDSKFEDWEKVVPCEIKILKK